MPGRILVEPLLEDERTLEPPAPLRWHRWITVLVTPAGEECDEGDADHHFDAADDLAAHRVVGTTSP